MWWSQDSRPFSLALLSVLLTTWLLVHHLLKWCRSMSQRYHLERPKVVEMCVSHKVFPPLHGWIHSGIYRPLTPATGPSWGEDQD